MWDGIMECNCVWDAQGVSVCRHQEREGQQHVKSTAHLAIPRMQDVCASREGHCRGSYTAVITCSKLVSSGSRGRARSEMRVHERECREGEGMAPLM